MTFGDVPFIKQSYKQFDFVLYVKNAVMNAAVPEHGNLDWLG